jgi:hypothetical protein
LENEKPALDLLKTVHTTSWMTTQSYEEEYTWNAIEEAGERVQNGGWIL